MTTMGTNRMIARTFPCDHDRLAELLADRLPPRESQELTAHVENCAACRQHLESLAGAGEDWSTARQALSSTALGNVEYPASASSRNTTSSQNIAAFESQRSDAGADIADEFAWVRSLLQPCESGAVGRLGTYAIRGVIGQGGMGVVLRGWDEELNRPLALKLLAPHLASSGAARQRFLREAQAAAAVVHPSVVPIYSINSEAPVPYLVMPLIGGGNLQQRIDREGPLELEDCLRIGLQIAEGLAAAHRQGLIHRDIKPANVLLEEGGHRVLISDFGLARALDDASMTASGVIAGTPPYMSPEQARGETADCRSDLFSLGSVIYAMATGRPPFRGESPLAVLRQIGEQAPAPIRAINERMPAWLQWLVERLMRKLPEQRPESARQVVEMLQSCLAHARNPESLSLPKEVHAPPEKESRGRRALTRSAGRAVAASFVLVTLPLFAYWWLAPSMSAEGERQERLPRASVPQADPSDPQPMAEPFAATLQTESLDRQIEQIQRQIVQLRAAIVDDLRSLPDQELIDE